MRKKLFLWVERLQEMPLSGFFMRKIQKKPNFLLVFQYKRLYLQKKSKQTIFAIIIKPIKLEEYEKNFDDCDVRFRNYGKHVRTRK